MRASKLLLIILLSFVALALFSCTENQRARQFGGKTEIHLESGKRLITATWKQDDLWYLTEPMPSGYLPQTKTFYEDSSFGIYEGSVTFIESK